MISTVFPKLMSNADTADSRAESSALNDCAVETRMPGGLHGPRPLIPKYVVSMAHAEPSFISLRTDTSTCEHLPASLSHPGRRVTQEAATKSREAVLYHCVGSEIYLWMGHYSYWIQGAASSNSCPSHRTWPDRQLRNTALHVGVTMKCD